MIKIEGNKFVCTGAAGFIGSHICEALIKQGKEVIGFDDLSNGTRLNVPKGVEFRKIDIATKQLFLMEGADTVFHNAASKCTVCREDPQKDLMTNAWGSFRIFDAAQHCGAKVIHASTGSVYGESGYQREDNQYAPRSFYGVSKLAGEQYLRCFEDLRWVGLRYFHAYGPRQDASDKGGVIPIFITKMLKGEPITIYGDGEQTRSFTYVKDVVNANFMAANSEMMEGDYYNVASGVKVSLNTLIELLADGLNVSPQIRYEAARPGDIWAFNVCNDKIAREGMDVWTNLQTGLKETIEYYATIPG